MKEDTLAKILRLHEFIQANPNQTTYDKNVVDSAIRKRNELMVREGVTQVPTRADLVARVENVEQTADTYRGGSVLVPITGKVIDKTHEFKSDYEVDAAKPINGNSGAIPVNTGISLPFGGMDKRPEIVILAKVPRLSYNLFDTLRNKLSELVSKYR